VLLPALDDAAQELVTPNSMAVGVSQVRASRWCDGATICLPTRCDPKWDIWIADDRAV